MVVIPIIPKPINAVGMMAELRKGVEITTKVIASDFAGTTQGWATKVIFKVEITGAFTGRVSTDNEIYGFVNNGTVPHIIAPKNAKVLAFGGGSYVAKTVPGVIGSRPSVKGSGGTVFAMIVHHPGTKARGFAKAIAKKRLPFFEQQMRAAMKRAAAVSGHG